MSESSFYEERAKQRAKEAVSAVEAQTSAEIVVCLRGSSAVYRDADYLFGFIVSVGALLAMLFGERVFVLASIPAGVIAAFLAGTVASAHVSQIRRILVFPSRMATAVRLAARGAFVDQGVSRTHGRTGVLVYASMFERRVEVVPDVGINAAGFNQDWKDAVAVLERSLRPAPDFERFIAAMQALGPVLATRLPHHDDDVNELPDDVQ
jgi:putative membrane protein